MQNKKYYPWLLVGLLCIVAALNYLDRMMIVTMRSSIVAEIPMSDAQFGLLTSVFLWVYGLASPFAGYMADRFDRSKIIIGSLFVWSLVTWFTSLSVSFEKLLITRALMGISEAFYIPAAVALIVDWHGERTKSTAIGIHAAGMMFGQSLGFVGAWLAEQHSWNYAFSSFGVVGIVFSMVLLFLLRSPKRDVGGVVYPIGQSLPPLSFQLGMRALFKNKAFNSILIVWALAGSISWMVSGWLPTYYQEKFSLSQTEAGLYSTAYFFPAMLIGVISGGAIADWWSRKNAQARLLLPAIGFLIAVPGVFLASLTPYLLATIVGFIIYAFTRPFIDANMMPILGMTVSKQYLATGYGFLNLCSCIVGGVGIFLAGALRDNQINLNVVFQLAAMGMIVCAVLLIRLSRRTYKINNQ